MYYEIRECFVNKFYKVYHGRLTEGKGDWRMGRGNLTRRPLQHDLYNRDIKESGESTSSPS